MPGTDILSSYPYVIVRIECRRCTRKGAYRLARLAAKYGAEIPMLELLAHLAGDCRAAAPTSLTSSFLPSLRIGRRKARGASASSKGAVSGAQTRRRAPPEQCYLSTAAHAPSLVDLERVFGL
jgi:hypothetical protein